MKRRLVTAPDDPLYYEFPVGGEGHDYREKGCNEPSHVIDESKLTGVTKALLIALRAADATIVWQKRSDDYSAGFGILLV